MVKRISLKCSVFLERHDAIDAAKNVISDAKLAVTDSAENRTISDGEKFMTSQDNQAMDYTMAMKYIH
ncbi:hypothetical protein [Paenibacillus sp. FSL H3-0333]|uniref:hypothetical protein n=1 Tax=Paenibacillus sp. FSL H3-0333 TaxID=2921373 RepID=UPI0030F680A7